MDYWGSIAASFLKLDLQKSSLEAKKKSFAMVDSKVHIQQATDMLKKLSGTLKMKPERHPKMDYLEK